MSLSLALAFRSYMFWRMLLPGAFLTIIWFLISAAFLVHVEKITEADVIRANLKVFEQELLAGEYVRLGNVLSGVSRALGWKEARISTDKGRVVAIDPMGPHLHTLAELSSCPKAQPIAAVDGTLVGTLCWNPMGMSRWMPLLTLSLGLLLLSAGLIAINYRGAIKNLSQHGEELKRLSMALVEGKVDADGVTPSSREGERLVQAIREFSITREKLVRFEQERENAATLAKLAAQVAHDIRSPVAALSIVSQMATSLPSEHRSLLDTAIQRIEAIASDLLERRSNSKAVSQQPIGALTALVLQVVRQKQFEYQQGLVEIEADLKGEVSGYFEPQKMARILSNIINNAVEVTPAQGGKVRVQVDQLGNWSRVIVEDEGPGISELLLPTILREGISVGKQSGHGLGLSDAYHTLESWGGRLQVQGRHEGGTQVSLWIQSIVGLAPVAGAT